MALIADDPGLPAFVRFGPKRTTVDFGPRRFVRFSNRPFEVKRFQAIHHCSVDVARGLVLLFGLGTMGLF